MVRVSDVVLVTFLAVSCLSIVVLFAMILLAMIASQLDSFFIIMIKTLCFLYFGFSVILVLLLKLLPIIHVHIAPRDRNFIDLCSILCFLVGFYFYIVYMCCLWQLEVPFEMLELRD